MEKSSTQKAFEVLDYFYAKRFIQRCTESTVWEDGTVKLERLLQTIQSLTSPEFSKEYFIRRFIRKWNDLLYSSQYLIREEAAINLQENCPVCAAGKTSSAECPFCKDIRLYLFRNKEYETVSDKKILVKFLAEDKERGDETKDEAEHLLRCYQLLDKPLLPEDQKGNYRAALDDFFTQFDWLRSSDKNPRECIFCYSDLSTSSQTFSHHYGTLCSECIHNWISFRCAPSYREREYAYIQLKYHGEMDDGKFKKHIGDFRLCVPGCHKCEKLFELFQKGPAAPSQTTPPHHPRISPPHKDIKTSPEKKEEKKITEPEPKRKKTGEKRRTDRSRIEIRTTIKVNPPTQEDEEVEKKEAKERTFHPEKDPKNTFTSFNPPKEGAIGPRKIPPPSHSADKDAVEEELPFERPSIGTRSMFNAIMGKVQAIEKQIVENVPTPPHAGAKRRNVWKKLGTCWRCFSSPCSTCMQKCGKKTGQCFTCCGECLKDCCEPEE